MSGCRALGNSEITATIANLTRTRDVALFVLGLKSGFRISELLSLKVVDVMQFGKILDKVTIEKKQMKGKHQSRSVALHPEAKTLIEKLILEENLTTEKYLFQSQRGPNRPISRFQAWKILKRAFFDAQLSGKCATHTMRKTFAARVYEKLDKDLVKTQAALGHRNIASTMAYMSFRQDEIDFAILGI